MKKQFTSILNHFSRLVTKEVSVETGTTAENRADAKPSLKSRLSKHLITSAAAVAMAAGGASDAKASVVYWNYNRAIGATVDGLYVNVETGVTYDSANANTVFPGWDINPYGSSSLSFFWSASSNGASAGVRLNTVAGGTTSGTAIASLPIGFVVGAQLTGGTSGASFGSGSATFTGTNQGKWSYNSDNYFGFRFTASDGLIHYGWGRIYVGASATIRTMLSVAYETVPGQSITVGVGDPTPACTTPTLSATTVGVCSGQTNGSIDLTVTGGTPTPLSYQWTASGSNTVIATTEDLSGRGAGTYVAKVMTASGGCYALGTYTISSTTSTTNTTTASACDSYTWSVNGTTYTQSGSYTSTSGCATQILNLTITPSTSNTTTETAVGSYTWALNGQTYTQSGTYSSVSGCATSYLNLTISSGCSPTPQPTLACYETATWNSTTCQWDITGTQPAQPTLACYESATFNTTTCSWDVTGTQPAQPTLACYESATFNTTTCSWDVTGTQPAQPALACYESATFNTTTCSWDVTGTQPAQPTLACYESATFNTTTCSWDVTGTQPQSPATPNISVTYTGQCGFLSGTYVNSGLLNGHYDFQLVNGGNTFHISYDGTNWVLWVGAIVNTGFMSSSPSNGLYPPDTGWVPTQCSYGELTWSYASTPLACYQTATFNTTTCSWDVTGTQPAQPTLACYESATFNTTTCSWDVTGTQPAQPALACYESATFNTTTCSWDVTGTQPAQPTLACYQSATFNGTTCSWDVTGTQPAQPTLACYESATFNGTTCSWDVTGTQPAQPTLACYESATFNGTTCSWDVTGTQPQSPATPNISVTYTGQCGFLSGTYVNSGLLNGHYDFQFVNGGNTFHISYDGTNWVLWVGAIVNTGFMSSSPSNGLYPPDTGWVPTQCSYGELTWSYASTPLACYQTATFNTTTCSWDVTGTQPAQPTLACYESATFNTTTCSWDVTGTQPAQPTLACYESATFNTTTCSWDVTGTQPVQPTLACYETATFNTTTCQWDVTGSPSPVIATTDSSCDSYTWSVNGVTYTASGTYDYNTNCQDYRLNLTIIPSTSNTTTDSACDSYTWAVNGTTYTQSGTYSVVTGCFTEYLNLVVTIDNQPPDITCPSDITQTADAGDCGAVVSIGLATGSDNCTLASITSDAPVSGHFPVGTTTITWTALDAHGNTSTCAQLITVVDHEAPVISCPAAVVQTADGKDCGAIVSIGTPSANDNCSIATITSDAPVNGHFPVGTTPVTWTAVDIHGNSSYCIQLITVTDNELPVITCPATVKQTADAGACGAYVSIGTPTATDNCSIASITSKTPANGFYPVGTTTVTWTAVDVNGNVSSCDQVVIVTDNEAPVISCLPAIQQSADLFNCDAIVSIGTATATDNCGVASITSDAPANSHYSVGITTVTWTAVDIHGNTSSCTQVITITDDEFPEITCPGDIAQIADVGYCGAVVAIGTATATDNCSVASITSDAPAGGFFGLGSTTVTWTATDAHGNSTSCTQVVVISENPTVIASASPASQTVCTGTPITTISLSSIVSGASYSWIRDNTVSATGIAASGTGNITGTLVNTTPDTVTVTFTITPITNGCSGTPITARVLVNPTSTTPSSITSSVALATPGANFTLTVNGGTLGTGATWKWYTGSCGGTPVGTGSTITVSQSVTTAYYVRGEGTCGNSGCASLTVNIQCGATSIASSAGITPVCAGSAVVFTPDGGLTTGAQWRWDDDCDVVPSTSDATATYTTAPTFTVNPTTTTTYYLQSVGGACGVTACLPVTVYVIPKPATPASINGAAIVCPSTSVTYSIASVPDATSYTWTAPTNATITSGQGTLTVTIAYASGFTSGTLKVRANNCSGSSADQSLAIAKQAAPVSPASISGSATVCPSTSVTYTIAAVANATSYTWTAPANATLASAQGGTSMTVNYGATFTSGTLSVTATGCGGTSIAKTLAITKQAAPASPASISGSATVCPSTSVTYTIAAVANATTYTWTAPANATLASAQGGTSMTINYGAAFTSGTLSVTATGCGGTSVAKTLAIAKQAAPASPASISGSATVCPSTSVTYTIAAVANATTYTWTAPANATLASAQGGTSMTINYGAAFTSGTLSVTATGCGGTSLAKTLSITKVALPAAPGSITGPVTGLCNQAAAQYSIVAVSGATSYTWTVPTGAVITSGQGTTAITVNYTGASLGSGSLLTVKSSNCAGLSAASSITLSSIPATPSGITGPNKPCKNAVVTYSTNVVYGATSYLWTVPSGWLIQSGQNSNTITVKAGTTSGAITVKAVSTCGTSAAFSLSVSIGNCTARVIEGNTAEGSSESLDVDFYPNPTTGVLHFEFGAEQPKSIEVYSMVGQLVMSTGLQAEVSLAELPSGTYFIRFVFGDTYVTKKVVLADMR